MPLELPGSCSSVVTSDGDSDRDSDRGNRHLLNKRTENPQRFPHGMSSKELQYSTLVK